MNTVDNNIAIAEMQKDIEHILKYMERIDKFIDTAHDTFATKVEHAENKKAIEVMQQEHIKMASRIMWSSISTILTVLWWFCLFILKKLWIM